MSAKAQHADFLTTKKRDKGVSDMSAEVSFDVFNPSIGIRDGWRYLAGSYE